MTYPTPENHLLLSRGISNLKFGKSKAEQREAHHDREQDREKDRYRKPVSAKIDRDDRVHAVHALILADRPRVRYPGPRG